MEPNEVDIRRAKLQAMAMDIMCNGSILLDECDEGASDSDDEWDFCEEEGWTKVHMDESLDEKEGSFDENKEDDASKNDKATVAVTQDGPDDDDTGSTVVSKCDAAESFASTKVYNVSNEKEVTNEYNVVEDEE